MTPLQSAAAAAESYLQSQRALEGLPAADILAERVIAAYEAARTADVSGLVERLLSDAKMWEMVSGLTVAGPATARLEREAAAAIRNLGGRP